LFVFVVHFNDLTHYWLSVQIITNGQYIVLGVCFTKANKKSIVNKMDNFLTRVSEETNCPKDKLTYTVTEYYTVFYTKTRRHLPKKITFDACGQKRTYKHNGLSGAILYWLLGSWTLEK
jgi:hypothetical protein